MTFRMALRSFAAQPVRSVVLACGFGMGIACMAGLLGVGEVILEQSRSPHLRGGGDVALYGAAGEVNSARFITGQLFRSPPLRGRVAAASPSLDATLYLVHPVAEPVALHARGGVPSLERALRDPEIAQIEAWKDSETDRAWAAPDAGEVLRAMGRFHPIPDVPARADSWAEWLYFNGRADGVRFYLSFLVGPVSSPGRRRAGVRLQWVREGRTLSYVERDEISEQTLLAGAPDLRIGANRIRLEGLRYRIDLALQAEQRAPRSGAPDLTGRITLDAVPGRSLPPFEIGGAGGWVSGYTVPVLSGALGGAIVVEGQPVSLAGGVGYHDHNWGFWEGVTWQWGQVAGESVDLLYGRIHPPPDAADAERIPGFLVALGPDGPLGFATEVEVTERDDPLLGRPAEIVVEGRSATLHLRARLEILGATRSELGGLFGDDGEFLQLQARYRVAGSIGERRIEFEAPGTAETFRGRPARG